MSWDLRVVVAELPSNLPGDPAFTIDAPVGVELEDLPEALAAAVLAPRFLIEISVPAAARDADRRRAAKLARQIARDGKGAVFDPQEDAVVWPKKRARTYVAPAGDERIREITLVWFVGGSAGPDVGRALLDGLRTACPDAMPRRYGDYEPLQHKLESGGEPGFIDFWAKIASHGGMFFWKTLAPCFGATVGFPFSNYDPPGHRRCTSIDLSFDGRALHADVRWREAIAALLPAVARRIGAGYAAGYVCRNVIAKRGSTWFTQDTEHVAMPGASFTGLPPGPTWLAWFGPAYTPYVAASFAGRATPAADGTLFFRAGHEPMDADQLAGHFPDLPAALRSHLETDEEYVKRNGRPPSRGEERRYLVPAEHIPLG